MQRVTVLKALVGSHNYNLATPESDKDYKVFVLPTFEDLYKGKQYSKQIITATEDNDIHDVRKLINLFYKSNINFLEVLASTELITPFDIPEIKEIISLKKDIFRMNLPYLYNACKGMSFNKLSLLDKGTEGTQHLVDLFGYDTKQAMHAHRVKKVIVDYEATDFEDFEGAINYNDEEREFMLSIKNGEFDKETFLKFDNHFYEASFVHMQEKYHAQPVNEELKVHLEELVMSMVQRFITNA